MFQKNGILFAHKAINIVSDLSGDARRVAGAIIDHFNKKTGQCDPSNGRLAAMLGIDERTVRKATCVLCDEKHQLFKKVSHGGKSSRASYTPNWSRFEEIVADWDGRMRTGAAPQELGMDRPKRAADTGPNGPHTPAQTGLQTLRTNQSNKPVAPSGASGDVRPAGRLKRQEPTADSLGDAVDGLLNGHVKSAVPPGYEARERNTPRGSTHAEAARRSAEARVDAAIAQLPAVLRMAYNELCGEDVREAAIQQEVRRRNTGIAVVRTAILEHRLNRQAEVPHAMH